MTSAGRILAVLAVLAYAALLASATSLWERDEPRFAATALQMARSGDLLVPMLGDELRPQKPILVYWLMAASMKALGPTPVAARFPSAMALALAAATTGLLAARTVGPGASKWAIVLLATSPLALLEGTAATADALLLAFTTAAIALGAGMREARGTARTVALGVLIGLALLTKGPVGLAVPVLVLLFARSTPRGSLVVASLLGLGLFALWFVPANQATGGRLLATDLGHEIVERSVRPLEGHGGRFLATLPYYLPVIALGFGPATLFLPAALRSLVRDAAPAVRRLLVAWIAAPLLLFTLVATKLPHYVLPIWPALAIAMAALLERVRSGTLDADDRRWMRRGLLFHVPAALLLTIGLAIAASRTPIASLQAPLVGLAILVAGFSAVAAWLVLRERFRAGVAMLLAGALATELVVGLVVAPRIDELKPAPRLVRELGVLADQPIATLGFEDAGLRFRLGARPIRGLASTADVADWLASPGRLLITTRPYAALVKADGVREVASARGLDVSKGEWIELVAFLRP